MSLSVGKADNSGSGSSGGKMNLHQYVLCPSITSGRLVFPATLIRFSWWRRALGWRWVQCKHIHNGDTIFYYPHEIKYHFEIDPLDDPNGLWKKYKEAD